MHQNTVVVDVHALQTRVGGEPVETREMNTPSWRDDVRVGPDQTAQQRQLSAILREAFCPHLCSNGLGSRETILLRTV